MRAAGSGLNPEERPPFQQLVCLRSLTKYRLSQQALRLAVSAESCGLISPSAAREGIPEGLAGEGEEQMTWGGCERDGVPPPWEAVC